MKTVTFDQFLEAYTPRYKQWLNSHPTCTDEEFELEIRAEVDNELRLVTWKTEEDYLLFLLKWA